MSQKAIRANLWWHYEQVKVVFVQNIINPTLCTARQVIIFIFFIAGTELHISQFEDV